jgi:SpoVK/Ycf46/Vps4 family AAA+-type ATPase
MSQADDIRDLAAACFAQPGVGILLKSLLAQLRQPGAAADLDQIFGVIDPGTYRDAALSRDVAALLAEKGRPDLGRRWSSRADELEPAKPAQSPWGGVSSVPGAGSRAHLQEVPKPAAEVVDLTRKRLEETGEAPRREPVSLEDVEGLSQVKEQIRRRIIQPFQAKGLYAKFKRRAGGGVLMYGPPGCGKTMLARATAHACDATFMPVEISEVLSKWVGDSEKRMKAIFDNARRSAPAILFFDEVEALARKRSFSDQSNVDSMVSVFLSEFDGMASANDGVLVLAATNVPWSVDPAFRRPGRFDRTLFVPPPDKEARAAILRRQLAKVPHVPGLDVMPIAEATAGFSGADLSEVIMTAADLAIDDSIAGDRVEPISLAHLKAARKECRATTLEWLTTARNYAEYANRDGAWDDLAAFLREHS